ncbi:MAG: hypothetical protein WBV26_08010, partial [Candidatus Sulfotelmatobacter sp.]
MYHRFIKEHGVNLLTIRDPEQKSSALYYEDGAADFRRSYLAVKSAADVTFHHAGRIASQPRSLQDTAVRNEGPLSPD